METSKNINLQNPKPKNQEDQNESISIKLDLPEKSNSTTVDHRDSSPDLFEFLTSTSYDDVSPAENIIFGGKLIPLNYQNTLQNLNHRIRTRSESLSALQGNKLNRRGDVARRDNDHVEDEDVRVMKTSRSLDYRKRNTNDSPPAEVKSTTKPETTSFGSGKSVKPRWYVIMFGMIKFPPEIELKDIKSRQIRRNIPPVLFPSPVNRNSRRSRSPSSSPSTSWKFLNALSCKQPTSAAATAPFWVPNA